MAVVAVVPHLVEQVLQLVAAARWVQLRYNTGGRYGIPVETIKDADSTVGCTATMKVIPVTQHAVERIGRLLGPPHADAATTPPTPTPPAAAAAASAIDYSTAAAATTMPTTAENDVGIQAAETELIKLVSSGDLILLQNGEQQPAPRTKNVGRTGVGTLPDHTVHPERYTPRPDRCAASISTSTGTAAAAAAGTGTGTGTPPAAAAAAAAGDHEEEDGALLPPFKFIELFAGIGGFRAGLAPIGGQCVFSSEIDAWATAIYSANYTSSTTTATATTTAPATATSASIDAAAAAAPPPPPATAPATPVIAGDILAIDPDSIPDHDLLTGGFPCQPFSTLGVQPGIGAADGRLFRAIVAVLKAKQPSGFLLENVPGLLTTDNGKAFRTIKAALEDAGYVVEHELLNARCLTAQARNRVYLVGRLKPTEVCGGACANGGADANDLRGGASASTNASFPPFEFPFVPDLRLRLGDVLEPEDALAAAGHHAGNYTLTQHQWQKLQGAVAWRRRGPSGLAWPGSIARAVISHYGTDLGGGASQLVPRAAPHNPRCFTPREALRLQGFDGNAFKLSTLNAEGGGADIDGDADADADAAGNDCDAAGNSGGLNAAVIEEPTSNYAAGRLYKMIGNAVVPPVICIIGASILAQLPRVSPPSLRVVWTKVGLRAAVRLAVKTVRPEERARVLQQAVLLPDGTAPALSSLLD